MDAIRKVSKFFLILLIFINIIFFFFYGFGFRVNLTPSIPLGMYRLSSEQVEKGKYVVFNPPQNQFFDEALQRGYLKKGAKNVYIPMFKKICAVPGDIISVGSSGVLVNGKLIQGSKPLGGGVNIKKYKLKKDEILLIGEVYNSFDSRYFGIVDMKNINSVIKTVYVW